MNLRTTWNSQNPESEDAIVPSVDIQEKQSHQQFQNNKYDQAKNSEFIGLMQKIQKYESADLHLEKDLLLNDLEWIYDNESRHYYLESCVEQDIAWQIRINREARKISQKDLAKIINTQQSAIARMEDPNYGKYSIPTLLKIAKVFDCALMLRFVPFGEFIKKTVKTSPKDLTVDSFTKEVNNAKENSK